MNRVQLISRMYLMKIVDTVVIARVLTLMSLTALGYIAGWYQQRVGFNQLLHYEKELYEKKENIKNVINVGNGLYKLHRDDTKSYNLDTIINIVSQKNKEIDNYNIEADRLSGEPYRLLPFEEILKGYIGSYKYYIPIFLLFLIFPLVRLFINSKYFLLPYNYNFFNVLGTQDSKMLVYDYLKSNKNGVLTYNNKAKSNYDKYVREQENIKNYFGWSDDEIDIERGVRNEVIMKKLTLAKLVKFDETKLKKGKVHLGLNKYGDDVYIDIKDELTHIIAVGETGSGKSVFINYYILNMLYSHEMVEKFYLIDPKLVELRKYKNLDKVEFITSTEDIIEAITNLEKEMMKRLDIMSERVQTTSTEPFIIFVMDEFGTLGTIPDSKQKKEVERIMINLAQKARRANIRIMLFGQKADTTNISSNILTNMPSKILMKTRDGDNIKKMTGTEDLENLSRTPRKFNKGRMIFNNGATSEAMLVQIPLFDLDIKMNENGNPLPNPHMDYLKSVVSEIGGEILTPKSIKK